MIHFEYHPVADLFPLMPDPELEALSRDIEANGLREPIWLHPDGRIIDGRNRYRACMLVGVEPDTRTWDGDVDLVAFVVSLNLHRRHLSEGQRAMIAAKIANIEPGQFAGNQHVPCANLRTPPVSQSAAAALMDVSRRSVQHATKVQTDGAPELVQAVESGAVPVSAAATVASELPPTRQAELVKEGPGAVRQEAAKIRSDRAAQRRAYTYRMQDLIRAATEASTADDDEMRAVPVNDLMLVSVAKARDLLTRFLAVHGKSDRTASA